MHSVIFDIDNNENSENESLLVLFYYLYFIVIPIVCYIGYLILCLILKYHFRNQIKKVFLIALFYTFWCLNGLDMFITINLGKYY